MPKPGTASGLTAMALKQPKNSKPQPKQIPESTASVASKSDFPIVGIGCSAGGLEALEAFLTYLPADSGMAIVIIQHLDPSYISTLSAHNASIPLTTPAGICRPIRQTR